MTGDAAYPRPRLASGGVYLRPAERDDIPRFVRWFSDAAMVRFLASTAPFSTAEEERWFERMLERQRTSAWFFVICRRTDGTPIGTIGLEDLDPVNGSAQVGIALGESRGEGLGSDAMRAILGFAFEELRLERVWLDVAAENAPAIRSYAKVGFVTEGTLRRAWFLEGGFHDLHRMAILRDEWTAAVARQRDGGGGDA